MTECCQIRVAGGMIMETKIVHVAVYDTMSDWEIGYATAHINSGLWQREPGSHKVVTVGETGEPVTTTGGMRILPDVAVADVDPADSAMLILAGADTWLTGGNGAFAKKAREFLDAGVPVAAICGATGGLATEGLLDDRDHTSNALEFLASLPDYKGAEHYRDEPAVNDDGLITASANAPADFAREVLGQLGVYEPSVLASWYKLYGEQNPAGYFE